MKRDFRDSHRIIKWALEHTQMGQCMFQMLGLTPLLALALN